MKFIGDVFPLLLLLVSAATVPTCQAVAATAVSGLQWASIGPTREHMHVSGATLTLDGKALYLVGNNRDRGCWWGSLDLETLQLAFYQHSRESSTEVCHSLTVDEQDGSLWVAGTSARGGPLSLLEGEKVDPDTLLYGMLIDVEFVNKEQEVEKNTTMFDGDEGGSNITDTSSTGGNRFLRGLNVAGTLPPPPSPPPPPSGGDQ